MKIHSRDYRILTQEEKEEWEILKEKEIVPEIGNGSFVVRKSLYREYPLATRHYISLFPNNHLDIVGLQQTEYLTSLTETYLTIIDDPNSNERSILNWIREEKAYYTIASIMKGQYSFGHHDAFIFREFQLGNTYQAYFLIVGKCSGGYEFIFIELEHPKRILLW